jgi:uncharacterized protein with HEPN domain
MELPTIPGDDTPLETTIEINERTGEATITNLLVNQETQERITARFRGLRGSDDAFMTQLMTSRSSGEEDWALLCRTCLQWGDETSLIVDDLISDSMPWSTLAWLRARLITGYYFRLP